MSDFTPRCCEICGGRILRNNTTGVCRNSTPECSREYEARRRRVAGIPERQKGRSECKYPGCPMDVNSGGWCCTHGDRVKKTGSPEPDGLSRQYVPVHAGDMFGFWTAIEDSDPRNAPVWCQCRCGNKRQFWPSVLHKGETQSCGCARLEIGAATRRARRQANPYMRAGEHHGMLTALEDALIADSVIACRCDCGNPKPKPCVAGWLRRGAVRSCGCTRAAAVSAAMTIHGLSKHPLYGTWTGMVHRCTNPKAPNYKDWGGRGIRVHEPWLDPAVFIGEIVALIGPRPDDVNAKGRHLYELDRIDNNGNYEPGNVRWADKKTQARNRRSVSSLTGDLEAALARVAELEAMLDR